MRRTQVRRSNGIFDAAAQIKRNRKTDKVKACGGLNCEAYYLYAAVIRTAV